MHDVAVRGRADRTGKHAGEVERAATGYFGQGADLDGLIQVGDDVVPEPAEHVLPQLAARQAFEFLRMTRKQIIDEGACHRVPEKRPVGITVGAFKC